MARPSLFGQIGYIYFIESETQSAVKIGFATNVYTRLKGLQTGNPDTLKLLAHVRSTYGAEQVLHKALVEHRIMLEWYRSSELLWILQNEIEDVFLDLAMEWVAEHEPHSSDPDALARAHKNVLIDGHRMRKIVEEVLADA